MLKSKVIIVTGGAGLLGRSFCETIAKQGGIPVIADIDMVSAEKVKNDIAAKTGGKAEAKLLDITSEDSVKELIRDLHNQYGKIDAVVNNAYPRNRNYGKALEDVAYNDFCENMNLHLGGYFNMAQKLGIFFKKQGHGNIINMSSIYGFLPPRFEIYKGTKMTTPVEYVAIKSAIIQLTKYLAQYYKGAGIRVNAISPGGIFDNQPQSFLQEYNSRSSQKGMLDPEDLSGTLLYLLSDASKYVTGQNIIVDDGFSL